MKLGPSFCRRRTQRCGGIAAQGRAQDRRARLQLRMVRRSRRDSSARSRASTRKPRPSSPTRRPMRPRTRQLARKQKRDFNRHFYSMDWTTAGETPSLLSLQSEIGSFEGGAHPNTSYDALLWDRRANRAITISSCSRGQPTSPRLRAAAYCKRLDAERSKRRGEARSSDLPEFNQCPNIRISPSRPSTGTGTDASTGSPSSPHRMLPGPYVEGEYEITLPGDAAVHRSAETRLSRLSSSFSGSNRDRRLLPGRLRRQAPSFSLYVSRPERPSSWQAALSRRPWRHVPRVGKRV